MNPTFQRAFCFTLLLFSGISVFAQELSYKRGIFNGTCTSTYPDGSLKASGNFNSSNRVGLWKFYAPGGVFLASVDYTWNLDFNTVATETGVTRELNIDFDNYGGLYDLPLDEKSVVWAKRVWRDISIADFPLPDDFDFWAFLAETPTEKPLKYYFDDQFIAAGVTTQDSLPLKQDVTGFRIKLDYFFRTDLHVMDARIVGIAPLYTNENGQSAEICWIYYHGTRAIFRKLLNTGQESFDYLFTTRQLPSVVYKEQTTATKPLEQSAADAESARIDREIIEVENAYIIRSFTERADGGR